MKVTKKPKRVKVSKRVVQRYTSCYTCPTCKVTYEGGGPASNVVRFVCQCGQELIVT